MEMVFSLHLRFGDGVFSPPALSIYKSGNRQECENYRPISILPIISKILERSVLNQIYKFLNDNSLLSKYQSGFRPKNSTLTALIQMCDTLYENMDNGELNGVVFLDIWKAFDSINHTILLHKMKVQFGITNVELDWFSSYLTDHRYILLSFNTGDIFSSRSGDYCSLVRSFCTFWKTQKDPSLVSLLDWWDKGKFYLRKVTRGFARARPAEQAHQNRALNKQLKQLQRLFDAGDSSAFAGLCSIQEKLRAIHLHEARYSPVGARCRWEEEGETSSAFFRSLEKKHRTKQLVSSIRDPDSGPIYHEHRHLPRHLGNLAAVLHEAFHG